MTNEEIAEKLLEDTAMDDSLRRRLVGMIAFQLELAHSAGAAQERARLRAQAEALASKQTLTYRMVISQLAEIGISTKQLRAGYDGRSASMYVLNAGTRSRVCAVGAKPLAILQAGLSLAAPDGGAGEAE